MKRACFFAFCLLTWQIALASDYCENPHSTNSSKSNNYVKQTNSLNSNKSDIGYTEYIVAGLALGYLVSPLILYMIENYLLQDQQEIYSPESAAMPAEIRPHLAFGG